MLYEDYKETHFERSLPSHPLVFREEVILCPRAISSELVFLSLNKKAI